MRRRGGSVNIIVAKYGYIRCGVVGKNFLSSECLFIYGLEVLVGWGNRRGVRGCRSFFCVDAAARTETMLRIWVAWIERWFGQDMEILWLLPTELNFIFDWNKNEERCYSNRMSLFAFKVLPLTTIDCVRCSFSDNSGEAMSIYLEEGNIRAYGELPVRESNIIVGGWFCSVLDTDSQERGFCGAWGSAFGALGGNLDGSASGKFVCLGTTGLLFGLHFR